MAFRIEISAEAELDAISILEWLIGQHAGDAGIRWFIGMQEAIESLANFPERHPIAPESSRFSFPVRQLLYGRKPHIYRILFTIRDNAVFVMHIRHGRRTRIGEPQ